MSIIGYYTVSSADYIDRDFVTAFAEQCHLDGPLSYEYDPKVGTRFILEEFEGEPPKEDIESIFQNMKPKEVDMDFVSFSFE